MIYGDDDEENLYCCHAMLAFIEDVKACEQCDTRNLNAVVYCASHRTVLTRLERNQREDRMTEFQCFIVAASFFYCGVQSGTRNGWPAQLCGIVSLGCMAAALLKAAGIVP